MPDPIREQIWDAMVTRLLTVTTGNGYEQTVTKVYRPEKETVNEYPCFVLHDDGTEKKRHLRLAFEDRIKFRLEAHVEKGSDSERMDACSKLLADGQKALMGDETLGGLARKIFLDSDTPEIAEPSENVATAAISGEILTRVKRHDPYAVRAI